LFPAEVQARESIDHGEIPRAEGHRAAIQLATERGMADVTSGAVFTAGRLLMNMARSSLAGATKSSRQKQAGQLIDMDVGHAAAAEHVANIWILGHARALDRGSINALNWMEPFLRWR